MFKYVQVNVQVVPTCPIQIRGKVFAISLLC